MPDNGRPYQRVRCSNFTFRATPEEFAGIRRRITLSGLSRQEYCLSRLLEDKPLVVGNPRAFYELRRELKDLCEELKRLSVGAETSEVLLDRTAYALRVLETVMQEQEGEL